MMFPTCVILALFLALPAMAKELSPRQQQILTAAEKAKVTIKLDQPYAENTNPKQAVDLYLPQNPKSKEPLPVIALIHGGAWVNGDRSGYASMAIKIAERGDYAVVGVGYRLTGEVGWPAQIHDCKAAIRWIRAHADKYHLDPNKIAVWGSSAGGHLAALLGTSGDVKDLEGTLGSHLNMSSRVQAVVNLCGPTDFSKVLAHDDQNQPIWQDTAVADLLGGSAQEKPELAKQASPVTFVSQDDPPFITFHGTQDQRVAFEHARLIHEALNHHKVPSLLIPITNGGHSSVNAKPVPIRAIHFLNKTLRGQAIDIDPSPIPAPPKKK